MGQLDERQQGYLFKLKLSKNVKRHIERVFWMSVGSRRAKAGKARRGS